MPERLKFDALIVAAGRGTRLATAEDSAPKQYLALGSSPVLAWTLTALAASPRVNRMRVVIHADDAELYGATLAALPAEVCARLDAPATGGSTRQASVCNGLEAMAAGNAPSHVIIHDAARPFLPVNVLERMGKAFEAGDRAVLAALPVHDTLKREGSDGMASGTVDRSGLWAAQTPQGFAFDAILSAHRSAAASGKTPFTDDTSLAEWAKMNVRLVEGASSAYKITTRADLIRARADASRFQPQPAAESLAMTDWSNYPDIRVATGYDVHAFEPGDAVILGGIAVPHERKLSGHSDADVVLHALTDAILGTISDKDIGAHFPPSDQKWKGAASDQFLVHALSLVSARGGLVAHLDVTIVCEVPKIGPVRDTMRAKIAEICKLPLGRVSVKATTSERLGFTGRKEGIAALATATIRLPAGQDEK